MFCVFRREIAFIWIFLITLIFTLIFHPLLINCFCLSLCIVRSLSCGLASCMLMWARPLSHAHSWSRILTAHLFTWTPDVRIFLLLLLVKTGIQPLLSQLHYGTNRLCMQWRRQHFLFKSQLKTHICSLAFNKIWKPFYYFSNNCF